MRSAEEPDDGRDLAVSNVCDSYNLAARCSGQAREKERSASSLSSTLGHVSNSITLAADGWFCD